MGNRKAIQQTSSTAPIKPSEKSGRHQSRRQWTSGLVLRVAAPLAFVLVAAPLAPSAIAEATSGSGRHCVAQAVPAGVVPAPLRCFPTFRGAIAAATGGRVQLPADTDPSKVTPDMINAGISATSSTTWYVLSLEWAGTGFSGNSLTWQASGQCGYFISGSFPSGWNDTIQSVALYSGCGTTLYWDTNWGGATYSININNAVSDLGSFDRQTSSEKWCAAYPCS